SSRPRSRDRLRFEVGRIGRGQGTDRQNAFCGGGRQSVCVFSFQSPARGRDCRTARSGRAGVDLYAASASDPAGNFVDDLFASEPRDDAAGSGIVLPKFLFEQTMGAGVSNTEAPAGAVFAADELLRSGILPGGGWPAAGAGLVH